MNLPIAARNNAIIAVASYAASDTRLAQAGAGPSSGGATQLRPVTMRDANSQALKKMSAAALPEPDARQGAKPLQTRASHPLQHSLARIAAKPSPSHPAEPAKSLNAAEKRTVSKALVDAQNMLDRSIAVLRHQGDRKVPGSTLTQRQVFAQYFGSSSPAVRKAVLVRLERVRDLVVKMRQAPNVGSYFLRAVPPKNNRFGYVQPWTGTKNMYLGDSFFKAPAIGFDSKAGTIVHELSHFIALNGVLATDHEDNPGKLLYSPQALRDAASRNPLSASRLSNLIEWYVEREK
jgi:Lysine-specific metallo-endopeptidase